jgi:hypothetical protein
MNAKELEKLQQTIDREGFDYAFAHYSEFKEIKDAKFHKLRKSYLEAYNKLYEYIYDRRGWDGLE